MAEPERIHFDFSGDQALDEAEKLERILRSQHWSNQGLSYESEETMLLLRLLMNGGIAVYRKPYDPAADASKELRQNAGMYELMMHKQSMDQILLDMAKIFEGHNYAGHKTVYNSLFFPDLKAYVRYGDLAPDRLFELLSQEDCDSVFLFQEPYYGETPAFHAILRAMPKDLFMEELEKMQEHQLEIMSEAARKFGESSSFVFPKVPSFEEE